MLRSISLLIIAAATSSAGAQQASPGLAGTLDGNVYTSPTGTFKMEAPVLPALGGVVRDTDRVVTFRDSYGVQISVGAFPHDATQRWELSTRGTKDYLIYFLTSFVIQDFKRYFPGTTVESAGFSVDLMDGSLFAYILLPGGSMFDAPPAFGQPAKPAVAKRGNMLFVKNGVTFVISTELSERVTEGSSWKTTAEEEDRILRNRLVEITRKIQFTKPAPGK